MTDLHAAADVTRLYPVTDADRHNAALTLAELADGDREGLRTALAMLGLSRDVSRTAQGRHG